MIRFISIPKIFRILLASLALAGVIGVLPIAQRQFTGAAPCPTLALLPACYLVLLGYMLVVVSAFQRGRYRIWTFVTGWIPLFILASTGTGLELFGQEACPRSLGGTPTCFLSFGRY